MSDATVGWLTILAMGAVAIALVTLYGRYQAFRRRDETPAERQRREQRQALRGKEAGPGMPG